MIMKKSALFLALTLAVSASAQKLTSKDTYVHLNASTPVEDIDAVLTNAVGILNTETNEAVWQLQIQSFTFKRALMQEHFNEKYMESETYPNSSFTGKINEQIDLTKEGEYDVTVSGKLLIHGVEQERTIPGKVIVKSGELVLQSDFKVKVVDHKIAIPKLVVAKIAEEISVKVNAALQPKK